MVSRTFRQALYCLLLLSLWTVARGELVLTNFSSVNPIKIMPVGDSITDDCVFNGAWRRYLQPLLDTNGYPFRFVGRYASAPSGSFTQVNHEGFCGAVVAPPGVFSAHGYSTIDCYLQKTVADALTSNIPDLVLVLIGANDIGRGRNPYQVATNDMPTLLNIIFSNAPNANVILAKITTLQNAMTGGLNYGAYSTNVPIYNACLQAMVNQQRALGKNVSLADMFSVVDAGTMFNGDHLHPNALGLQAIAQEWFTRIQAITITTNTVTTTLVHGGDNWNYNDQGQDPGANWVQLNYDDRGWSNGPARLGFGSLADATTISYGASTTNINSAAYFRHSFVAPDNVVFTNLNIRLARVDGAVVWLNGQEAFRTNMPAGPISYTNVASRSTILDPMYIFYPTNLTTPALTTGTNILAVEVHPSFLARVTGGFDLEMIGTGYYFTAPPAISIVISGGNVLVSWPADSGAGYTLYSTTNLPGNWSVAPATLQTNGAQVIATLPSASTSEFFRLQKP
jgi:lysophospholipase L1-like esterase